MRKIWVKVPGPVKLTISLKMAILGCVRDFIIASKTLAHVTYRVDLRNGRVYLYFLHQPATLGQPGVTYAAPLIEDKYLEDCYARITLFDAAGLECSTEWQKQAGQWVVGCEGSLDKCLKCIEEKDSFQATLAGLDVKRSPYFPLELDKALSEDG